METTNLSKPYFDKNIHGSFTDDEKAMMEQFAVALSEGKTLEEFITEKSITVTRQELILKDMNWFFEGSKKTTKPNTDIPPPVVEKTTHGEQTGTESERQEDASEFMQEMNQRSAEDREKRVNLVKGYMAAVDAFQKSSKEMIDKYKAMPEKKVTPYTLLQLRIEQEERQYSIVENMVSLIKPIVDEILAE